MPKITSFKHQEKTRSVVIFKVEFGNGTDFYECRPCGFPMTGKEQLDQHLTGNPHMNRMKTALKPRVKAKRSASEAKLSDDEDENLTFLKKMKVVSV